MHIELDQHERMSADTPRSDELRELGTKLGALRAERGLTISELAQSAEVSSGFISQLERGRGNPSFMTMMKLSRALDVPIGTFFLGDDHEPHPGIVPGHSRRRLAMANDMEYELLTPSTTGKLLVYLTHTPPRWTSGDVVLSHEGEEFIHVLEGELLIEIAGVPHRLVAGDSITFDSSQPHLTSNPGDVPLVAMACQTPPGA
jgi:transcriptional regulator with XRE-family HTH domain